MSYFLPIIITTAIISLFIIISLLLVRGEKRINYALIFIFLSAFDTILIKLATMLDLNPDFLHLNWIGKFLSLIWILVFIFFGPFSFQEIGLTKKLRKNSIIKAITIISIVLIPHTLLTILFPSTGIITIEDIIFQATMPGITEELLYRGILFTLILYSLGGTLDYDKNTWNREVILSVIITSLLFGLDHTFYYDDGLHIYILPFIYTLSLGLFYIWLRIKTGSLLLPILTHNVMNLIILILSFLLKL